jgi:hypothetical protein
MTHWHTPAHREPANPWTAEEWDRADKLRNDGADWSRIAELLGRSHKAVKAKFQLMNFTPEQREAKREYQRRKRDEKKKYEKSGRQAAGLQNARELPCAEIFIERDRRLALPARDLTAAFCGDPKPGFSALDKRSGA